MLPSTYRKLNPAYKTVTDVAFMAFMNWLEHNGIRPVYDDRAEDVLDSMSRYLESIKKG